MHKEPAREKTVVWQLFGGLLANVVVDLKKGPASVELLIDSNK